LQDHLPREWVVLHHGQGGAHSRLGMFLLDADGMFRQLFLLDDDAFLIDMSPSRAG
jgi:hypothetical protein